MLNRLPKPSPQLASDRFGDLRRLQPLYLLPPVCSVSALIATEFLDLARSSICFDLIEKCYFLLRLPNLPTWKIEKCIAIWREEQLRFRRLPHEFQPSLLHQERRALAQWWRVERWFWQHGFIEHEPMLWIGLADPRLPANVELLLRQLAASYVPFLANKDT